MAQENRRSFIKTVGVGMGAVATSGLWLNKLFANTVQPVGEGVFGFTKEDIKKLLGIALSKGGEFSELYFENTIRSSVNMSEEIIKSSSESISLGVGIRVIKGDQTGYAYTNELTFDKIKHAALTAAAIASGPSKMSVANLNEIKPKAQTYDMISPLTQARLQDKIKLIKEGYDAAKNADSKITKISASIADEIQRITIANSEGLLVSDIRPQARLRVTATAEKDGKLGTGSGNAGGRIGSDFYMNVETPTEIGKKAAKEALALLEAENAPAGELPVILSKDQSGVMIHEAVGHPLEADANRKKQSIMWDKMGTMVSSPLLTIYDDATIPNYRGSLNIDDEGTQVEKTMLIEKGKLVGFLNDKLSAKLLNHKENGHGRRQSYKSPPLPRMSNTVLASGDTPPEEMIASVKKGFYAVTYQGGMVNNAGDFTFSVNLGYLIENGKLTRPLRNATLIGSNVQILKRVDMVGNDMGFFLGTCGKAGQSVPVTAGTPSLRISKMTVGGV